MAVVVRDPTSFESLARGLDVLQCFSGRAAAE